jgi:SAM-dependent methyltransferase
VNRRLNRLAHTATVAARLLGRGRSRALAFYLDSIGELQFSLPLLRAWSAAHPGDLLIVAHRAETWDEFDREAPDLAGRAQHVASRHLQAGLLPGLDLFLSSSQGVFGPRGVYSIATFHGQPSKGLTFTAETVEGYDAFFLYGALHRQALDEFLQRNPLVRTGHLRVCEVGYPKSDEVLSGAFRRNRVLGELGLDPGRPTVLYAPAFNDGASMREAGEAIVRTVAAVGRYNVLIKLAIDCRQPTRDLDATGGVDWFERFRELERGDPRIRLVTDHRVDPALAAADVLVTCVSSVSFEMLALGKPVVFFDTPRFFSRYLRSRFPGEDTVAWAERTTVNAGREFGPLVGRPEELPAVLDAVLADGERYPLQKSRLPSFLLYNPGCGTAASVRALEAILAERPASSRPRQGGSLAGAIARRARRLGSEALVRPLRRAVGSLLHAHGLAIVPSGSGYLDVARTKAAARAAGVSLCDYLEGRESDPRKRGRRDRIVARLAAGGLLDGCSGVVEIGAGTGMFLEKVAGRTRAARYEVYETDSGWAGHLRTAYGHLPGTRLIVQDADGETLSATPAASCELVHAHAVFVYIPPLRTFSYLAEAARVLAPGGHLVFDALLDTAFGAAEVERWLRGPWRFPVILPEALLMEVCRANGLDPVFRFTEVYGSSVSEYLVFRRRSMGPQDPAPHGS